MKRILLVSSVLLFAGSSYAAFEALKDAHAKAVVEFSKHDPQALPSAETIAQNIEYTFTNVPGLGKDAEFKKGIQELAQSTAKFNVANAKGEKTAWNGAQLAILIGEYSSSVGQAYANTGMKDAVLGETWTDMGDVAKVVKGLGDVRPDESILGIGGLNTGDKNSQLVENFILGATQAVMNKGAGPEGEKNYKAYRLALDTCTAELEKGTKIDAAVEAGLAAAGAKSGKDIKDIRKELSDCEAAAI